MKLCAKEKKKEGQESNQSIFVRRFSISDGPLPPPHDDVQHGSVVMAISHRLCRRDDGRRLFGS